VFAIWEVFFKRSTKLLHQQICEKNPWPARAGGKKRGIPPKIFANVGKIRIFAVPNCEMADELQK
jgi:hypothetical protein